MSKKKSGISIYRQIADILILRIKQGAYKPGERLPSDRDLSDEFGHNRHTVRRALDILEGEKLITRQRGRGTFVVDMPHVQGKRTSLRLGLVDLAKEIGERPKATLLDTYIQSAEKDGVSHKIPFKDEYYVVHRLRLVADDPLIIETIHIPISTAPDLLKHDLVSSLRELLLVAYGIQIVRVDISIESIISDAYMSRLLEIPIGAPLILEKRVAYTADDTICEYSEHIYRGDRFTFSQEFHKQS
ncbi:MAG: hypothetical protein CL607_24265 [Anaerolineaceae bacterium]|nr:hypothetical protein [Anaerolineaceae bacterium]